MKFSSAFFNLEQNFTIGPKENRSFNVQLNNEDFKALTAGFYTLTAEVSTADGNAKVEGTIKFVEKNIVTSTKQDYGFLINTQIIEKRNEGNS